MNSNLLDDYLGKKKKNNISKYFTKILICIIVFTLSLIYTKYSDQNLSLFKKYVFTDNFNFMKFRSFYNNLSFDDKTKVVSSENLTYLSKEKHLDGEKYILDSKNVGVLTSGIVVYVGNKEGYNNTVIIQGSDGFDFWYGNIENINASMYDYLKSGTIIGEVENEMYLVIYKNDKYYTYEEYLSEI